MKKSQLRKIIKESIKQLMTEQLGPRMSNPRPTGPSNDQDRPDINSKTLLDLIARDLKFAGIYQNPEMLAYEEAVEIMDHVIGMTGEDYTGQTALLDYINDGEFEKGDKDIYIEPKRN